MPIPIPGFLVPTLAMALLGAGPVAGPTRIDLRTGAGVAKVGGAWRYSPVTLREVPGAEPGPTYDYAPRASGADFDDSAWPVIDPTSLGKPRGGGKICFAWYRIAITVPPEAKGHRVFFETTVDDYGEVWIDGALPRKVGDVGGPIVAGFNTPNRVELVGAVPGRTYKIAVFGINGPISDTPTNRIFLGPTTLELVPGSTAP